MEGIPEWLYWLATGIGTAIGALVVKAGWNSETRQPPETMSVIAGALVDSESVRALSGEIALQVVAISKQTHSIEALAMAMKEGAATARDAAALAKDQLRASDQRTQAILKLEDEIKELRHAMTLQRR
ncbi:hypothetical protein [Antarcticirhabdus aurantiaca]|uniref:Uncharacterized protein n=1 Tax=Antarcticirhabdus aurantiaca TaxID=2606717 RepID=A0ACD4NK30_9HYPH|nr:hypothetical protein [Antarcticirhabdus aurantiaca]WAJ27128.1 hypothetical protein OXU80_20060 [Jeongeuplla avenae]